MIGLKKKKEEKKAEEVKEGAEGGKKKKKVSAAELRLRKGNDFNDRDCRNRFAKAR